MSLPAGSPPPVPADLSPLRVAHAIDGDGSAVCSVELKVEQVDALGWSDVPQTKQCTLCALIVAAS
jgi:hypothetical protein